MAWLFAEYSIAEGYTQSPGRSRGGRGEGSAVSKYSLCLTELMLGAKAKLNPRDRLFTKLVLEAPRITPEAMEIIRSYCRDEVRRSFCTPDMFLSPPPMYVCMYVCMYYMWF